MHIDEHSDLWENTYDIDIIHAIDSDMDDFVNKKCNV
jgi:hypothetical protein